MSEEFTDGEWCVDVPFSTIHIKVKDRKGKPGKLIGTARDIYDAHLMTSAPEMYKFLESLQLDVANDYRRDEILAKARGE